MGKLNTVIDKTRRESSFTEKESVCQVANREKTELTSFAGVNN